MWSRNVIALFNTLKHNEQIVYDHLTVVCFQFTRQSLTQLISFGPIAGDAFSVSDDWISLFRSSTPSSSNLLIRFGGRDGTDFFRFSTTWSLSVGFSSLGNFEKRCVYVITMESFSIELSDGRRLRSKASTQLEWCRKELPESNFT